MDYCFIATWSSLGTIQTFIARWYSEIWRFVTNIGQWESQTENKGPMRSLMAGWWSVMRVSYSDTIHTAALLPWLSGARISHGILTSILTGQCLCPIFIPAQRVTTGLGQRPPLCCVNHIKLPLNKKCIRDIFQEVPIALPALSYQHLIMDILIRHSEMIFLRYLAKRAEEFPQTSNWSIIQ